MSYFDDVREFNQKFGLKHHPAEPPVLLTHDVEDYRVKFMMEELSEFHQAAVGSLSLPDAVDALVDLVYVALGTAHMMGVDFDAHWRLVHHKNMLKERVTDVSQSKRGTLLDCRKPEGWTPPDHTEILLSTDAQWGANNN